MKTTSWLAVTGVLILTLAAGWTAAADKDEKPAEQKADNFTFSGPYTHDNLTIFLVHGKDVIAGKQFLTLQEALEKKKIVVHETKNVNELSVENVSDDVEVFIQAGDIVKGGQQDRVLGYDIIVNAKSGKLPLPSFCVEAGRWQKRGNEDAKMFQSNPGQAAGKELKLAINSARNQNEVWAKVKEAQMKLSKNVGQQVESKESPTSYQLTIEDKKLLENVEKYTKAIEKITEEKKDVIGYVLAINGKVEGADIYGSSALFQKLWPKLAKAAAVDALAEQVKDKKFEPATVDGVKAFLADAAKAKKETNKDVSKRVRVNTREGEKSVYNEACDQEQKGTIVHRNYIAK